MSFFEHRECLSSNTRNVFPRTQGMFSLRTQGMSCFERKECLSSNTRNVVLQTHKMFFFEHKECPSWNTRKFSAVLCALPFRQCNKRNTAIRSLKKVPRVRQNRSWQRRRGHAATTPRRRRPQLRRNLADKFGRPKAAEKRFEIDRKTFKIDRKRIFLGTYHFWGTYIIKRSE